MFTTGVQASIKLFGDCLENGTAVALTTDTEKCSDRVGFALLDSNATFHLVKPDVVVANKIYYFCVGKRDDSELKHQGKSADVQVSFESFKRILTHFMHLNQPKNIL